MESGTVFRPHALRELMQKIAVGHAGDVVAHNFGSAVTGDIRLRHVRQKAGKDIRGALIGFQLLQAHLEQLGKELLNGRRMDLALGVGIDALQIEILQCLEGIGNFGAKGVGRLFMAVLDPIGDQAVHDGPVGYPQNAGDGGRDVPAPEDAEPNGIFQVSIYTYQSSNQLTFSAFRLICQLQIML